MMRVRTGSCVVGLAKHGKRGTEKVNPHQSREEDCIDWRVVAYAQFLRVCKGI